jgi:hypothetical protein
VSVEKGTKRRKKPAIQPLPEGWVVSDEYRANGRHIEKGTELSIVGERGRFIFLSHVVNGAGAEWINVFGGPVKHEILRSFRPERIKRVHRLNRTRKNAA